MRLLLVVFKDMRGKLRRHMCTGLSADTKLWKGFLLKI